jgi:hypothetical protein
VGSVFKDWTDDDLVVVGCQVRQERQSRLSERLDIGWCDDNRILKLEPLSGISTGPEIHLVLLGVIRLLRVSVGKLSSFVQTRIP